MKMLQNTPYGSTGMNAAVMMLFLQYQAFRQALQKRHHHFAILGYPDIVDAGRFKNPEVPPYGLAYLPTNVMKQ